MSAKSKKKERKEQKLNESDSERLDRWAKTSDFKLLKPFGPNFGLVAVPSEVLGKLIELTDKILEDENRIDWGSHLVGQVKEEPWVSNKQLKEIGVFDYLTGMLYNYVWNSLLRDGHEVEKLEVHLDHMWIVSQYENEYNPIHFHTYCDLSSVMWLRVPDFGDRVKEGKPGKMALFPSNLLHTVYPFQGPGERRCVAFNSHWNALLKNGKMIDKAMRQAINQDTEEYKKSLRSKGEISGFAERQQGSPDSGNSEEKNES